MSAHTGSGGNELADIRANQGSDHPPIVGISPFALIARTVIKNFKSTTRTLPKKFLTLEKYITLTTEWPTELRCNKITTAAEYESKSTRRSFILF